VEQLAKLAIYYMKLDYKHNINEYGDHVVRLYQFNQAQSIKFRDAIQSHLLVQKKSLVVDELDFMEIDRVRLTLRLADEDFGITSRDGKSFYCDLTHDAYVTMVKLLQPFCLRESKSFQMLFDVDTLTDLMFSPAGTD
jgi:hypothetical protein